MKALKEIFSSVFNVLVLIICIALGYVIYKYIMGNPLNFIDNNPKGHPIQGNYLGIIYKGGFIVPILMATILVLLTFVIERFISLSRASGKGRISNFLKTIQNLLNENKIEDAAAACDKQKGSLANVVKAGLYRYRDLQGDHALS